MRASRQGIGVVANQGVERETGRLIVLGLDGGTFDLIVPLARQGKLPNLCRLMDAHCWGHLESTIPPLTAVAWSTFATGKNAGKHGLFDFVCRQEDGYGVRLVNGGDRHGAAFWQLLDRSGYRVGVVNVPMTYPPDHLTNGFVIAGFDAPGVEAAFVHPPELKARIMDLGYQMYTRQDNLDVWADSLFEVLQAQQRVFWALLAENRPDVMVLVLSQLDAAQHLFWRDMAEGRAPYAQVIPRLYQEMDAFVGQLQAAMSPADALVIVSDHGAGALKKAVSVNQWLLREGYLCLRQDAHEEAWRRQLLARSGRWLARNLPRWAKSIIKQRLPQVRDGVQSYLLASRIDWQRTRAFSLGEYGGIFLNLRGREREGLVLPDEYDGLRDEIAGKLLCLRDPDDGALVVEEVHRREHLYHGAFLDQAPDLVLRWNYQYDCGKSFGNDHQSIFDDCMTYRMFRAFRKTGVHRLNGIFLACGEPVRPGCIDGARLLDIAPTLLHLMGAPVPADMDGRVLGSALRPEWLAAHPVSRAADVTPAVPPPDSRAYDAAEEAAVRDRLRNLGYLD